MGRLKDDPATETGYVVRSGVLGFLLAGKSQRCHQESCRFRVRGDRFEWKSLS